MELSAGAEELRLLPATWSSATRPFILGRYDRHQREYPPARWEGFRHHGHEWIPLRFGYGGLRQSDRWRLYLVDIATGTGGSLNTGNLSLSSASVYTNVNGPTPGVDYSQIRATGTVDLSNSNLDVSLSPSVIPSIDQTYILIDNDGSDPVTGTFSVSGRLHHHPERCVPVSG